MIVCSLTSNDSFCRCLSAISLALNDSTSLPNFVTGPSTPALLIVEKHRKRELSVSLFYEAGSSLHALDQNIQIAFRYGFRHPFERLLGRHIAFDRHNGSGQVLVCVCRLLQHRLSATDDVYRGQQRSSAIPLIAQRTDPLRIATNKLLLRWQPGHARPSSRCRYLSGVENKWSTEAHASQPPKIVRTSASDQGNLALHMKQCISDQRGHDDVGSVGGICVDKKMTKGRKEVKRKRLISFVCLSVSLFPAFPVFLFESERERE